MPHGSSGSRGDFRVKITRIWRNHGRKFLPKMTAFRPQVRPQTQLPGPPQERAHQLAAEIGRGGRTVGARFPAPAAVRPLASCQGAQHLGCRRLHVSGGALHQPSADPQHLCSQLFLWSSLVSGAPLLGATVGFLSNAWTRHDSSHFASPLSQKG